MKKSIFVILLCISTAVIAFATGFSPLQNLLYSKAETPADKDTLPPFPNTTEVVGPLLTDDPWVEIAKLYDTYNLEEGTSIAGTMKLIDASQEEEQTVDVQDFEYAGNTKRYYYKIGHMEFAGTEKMEVVADNVNKILKCSARKGVQQVGPFDLGMFKNMLRSANATAHVYAEGNHKVLVIDSITHPQIQGYRIYYSPENHRISKILVGMARLEASENEGSGDQTGNYHLQENYYYAEMNYAQINPMAVPFNSFRPEEKFIKAGENGFELTTAYQDYQLISSQEH